MLSLVSAGGLAHHGVLAFEAVQLRGLVGTAGDEAGNHDRVIEVEGFGCRERFVSFVEVVDAGTGVVAQSVVLIDESIGLVGLGILEYSVVEGVVAIAKL